MIKNKNILVTGCYGFVAQHLINRLLNDGNTVVGIFNKKYQLQIFNNAKFKKINKYYEVKGDIRNKKFIRKIFNFKKFHICYHLAAISQVLDSNKNPIETFEVNLFGTINILECIREQKSKIRLIFSSSDKVYGDNNKLPYNENSNFNALNPYDASKASADIIARTYANTFNINVCVTRFVNIYGPGDVNWDRLIPGVIKSIMLNKIPIIRSNGKFLRDYLYIDDVIEGYVKLGAIFLRNNKLINGIAFNFGTKKPKSVIEVVKQINIILNKKKNYYLIKNKTKNEIKDQYSSYNLANKYLKWSPKISLKNGLILSCSWYKKNSNRF